MLSKNVVSLLARYGRPQLLKEEGLKYCSGYMLVFVIVNLTILDSASMPKNVEELTDKNIENVYFKID